MTQYAPSLRAAGVDVSVEPLLDDDYVRGLYAGTVSVSRVARSYLHRLWQTRSLRDVDVVWLEKEAWPWLPHWLELPLLGQNTRLVVDYDDAVFHRYDAHRRAAVRAVLGEKISRVMKRADLVTAGNAYLADHAREAGARDVAWLPTVVDLSRYPMVAPPLREGALVVGWVGSPSTAPYLRAVADALAPLQAEGRIRCLAIGARPDQLHGTPFDAVPWSEDTEVTALQGCDIGIMPLPDEPWERGKCGYKLVQYMACGMPVVASPVGVNTDLVTPGKNGFLATDGAQWKAAVTALVEDASLRRRMGESGRARVKQTYSLQAQAPRLLELLRRGAGQERVACVD